MMLHLIKYRFKNLLQDKSILFWTLLFPIVLATFFGMTLKDAYTLNTLKPVNVAIINNDAYSNDPSFQTFIESISQSDGLFNPQYVDEQTANQLLNDGFVKGIITKTDSIQLTVKSTGIDQTILKTVTDEYLSKSNMIQHMLENGADYQQVLNSLDQTTNYLQSNTNDNTNLSSVFFFTIIAMCSLYGGTWFMRCVSDTTANLSDRGIRFSAAPVKKHQVLIADFIVSNVIQYCIMMILIAYLIFIIKIDFGDHIPQIFLTTFVGVLAGSSLGSFIGVIGKQSFNVKSGTLTAVTMLGSFLSGMMAVQIKYYVQVYAPIIAKINPANLITDALYSLYYYGIGERFYSNIISLGLISLILFGFSFIILRRKQYDSL